MSSPRTIDVRTAAKDLAQLSRFSDEILTLHDPDYHGYSVLHYASRFGKRDVCQALLSRGIDPNIRNFRKETAAKIARQYGFQDIADLINAAVQAKISPAPTVRAAERSVEEAPSPPAPVCPAAVSSRAAINSGGCHRADTKEDACTLEQLLAEAVALGLTDNHGVEAVRRNLRNERFTVQYYVDMWTTRLATEAPKGNPHSPSRTHGPSQPSRMAAILRADPRAMLRSGELTPPPREQPPEPPRSPSNTSERAYAVRSPGRSPCPFPAQHKPRKESPGGPLVVIWDFDDTLVPWYRMKRAHGDPDTLGLFDAWFGLNQAVQQSLLAAQDRSWEGAARVSELSGAAQGACRASYGTPRERLGGLGGRSIARLEQSTEAKFSNWMSQARGVLERVARAGGVNLLVTAAPLCAAVAKAMIFGFGEHFQLGHVYSAAEDMSGKTKTIQMAMQDGARAAGGGSPSYVVVGDGKAEEKSAKELRLRFVKVRGWEDLLKVRA